jgi:hypothetical protein
MKRSLGRLWFMILYVAERIMEKELKIAKCGEKEAMNKRLIVT